MYINKQGNNELYIKMNGYMCLISYETVACALNTQEEKLYLNTDCNWSNTTRKHLYSFLRYFEYFEDIRYEKLLKTENVQGMTTLELDSLLSIHGQKEQ